MTRRKTKKRLSPVEQLHQQLEQDALQLAQAIEAAIDGAPLNQLATALGTVVDRYLKLDEYLQSKQSQESEQVIRIEYQYPDGTIHSTPPWANDDYEIPGAIQSDRLRQTLRQDGIRQDDGYVNGATRQDVLVAGTDVSDGESGMAGLQTDPQADQHAAHQRD